MDTALLYGGIAFMIGFGLVFWWHAATGLDLGIHAWQMAETWIKSCIGGVALGLCAFGAAMIIQEVLK